MILFKIKKLVKMELMIFILLIFKVIEIFMSCFVNFMAK